ncbi:MAG: hypothetical protein U0074_08385 [Kouleothrix sp.]
MRAALFGQWQGGRSSGLMLARRLRDIGTIDFHEPEQGSFSYRWSRPEARLRLYAPPPEALAQLRLRMFAPSQPDGPQHVVLSANGVLLADVAAEPRLRMVRFVLPGLPSAPLEIELRSAALKNINDSRPLGVAVDANELGESLMQPDATMIARELWSAPYLPLGMLLLAGCALLLRLGPLWLGGLFALALAALYAADYRYHDARLLLAWYLVVAAGVACAALATAAVPGGVCRV